MRAIGFSKNDPIDHPEALVAFKAPEPEMRAGDLLVEIEATSVNPADAKLRQILPPLEQGQHILGYDAVGRVIDVGTEVKDFRKGDRVWYAGTLDRPGTNAERHAVDHRIASNAPKTLTPANAAALPLTAITAWEILFDRLKLGDNVGDGQTILIVGAAGGVGSILIQLARTLTNLTIVATASRSETIDWVHSLGAHHVINHHEVLSDQLNQINLSPNIIAGLTGTAAHFPAYADIISPQGSIVVIDDPPAESIDVTLLKQKSVSLNWEFMFTRPMFGTSDVEAQGALLGRVARMVDEGVLRSTATHNLGPLTVDNLREAHARIESGLTIGKLVLDRPDIAL